MIGNKDDDKLRERMSERIRKSVREANSNLTVSEVDRIVVQVMKGLDDLVNEFNSY